jgi:hypothetical protein
MKLPSARVSLPGLLATCIVLFLLSAMLDSQAITTMLSLVLVVTLVDILGHAILLLKIFLG